MDKMLVLRRFLASATVIFFPILGSSIAHAVPRDFIVEFPATGVWNGFNENFNVIECNNYNLETVELTATVRSNQGATIGTLNATIPSLGTWHGILNNFDITNQFGTYVLALSEGNATLGERITCYTSIYRFAPAGSSKQVEYAFTQPVVNALRGTSAGLFNSIDPEAAGNPTFNWLSIFNPGTESFSAEVFVYDFSGNLQEDKGFSISDLAAGERRDFGLGHTDTAANGEAVGLYRIVPTNSSAPYGAFLTRYKQNGSEFQFAFPLPAVTGSCDGELVPASTMDPADNWAEIANPGDTLVSATLEVYDRSGSSLGNEQLTITPRSQVHVYLNQFLGTSNIGSFRVSCEGQSATLLIQSLFYGRQAAGSSLLEWSYASQARGRFADRGFELVSPINTYLEMANWFKVLNGASQLGAMTFTVYDDGGNELSSLFSLFNMGSLTSTDIGVHQSFASDRVGSLTLSSNLDNSLTSAVLLRVFPHDSANIGYVMQVPAGIIAESLPSLTTTQVATGLTQPLALINAGDGSNRLFVLEKTGQIKIIQDGSVLGTPFLDLSGQVSTNSEQGLLGLAFHPEYTTNGVFFVNYTDSDGDTVISEFRVTADPNVANASSERIVLTIAQPGSNHNGGDIRFGPDGFLYISSGDGGGSGDPNGNGQRMDTLLGTILRIDIDTGLPYAIPSDNPFVDDSAARDEIWAYGFRNPWRFSFDSDNGRLFVGDVGEGQLEEVDLVEKGRNYGWNTMEGSQCFSPSTGCDTTGLELPIAEYDHQEGLAIIGGFVYRGSAIPALRGKYVFGDFARGKVWILSESTSGEWVRTELSELSAVGALISAFGQDENGELYIVDFNGTVYRIDPAS